jgi:hypothetical protein
MRMRAIVFAHLFLREIHEQVANEQALGQLHSSGTQNFGENAMQS